MSAQLSMLVLPNTPRARRLVRFAGVWVTRAGRTLLAVEEARGESWTCPFCPGGNTISKHSGCCARCRARVTSVKPERGNG